DGTSYVQQKQIAERTDQASVNPKQQMLMKIMPLCISIISLTLPAGIVVYFFISNFFRIDQQAYITRTIYKYKEGTHIQTTARDTSDGSSEPSKGLMAQLREAAGRSETAPARSGGTKAAPAKKKQGGGSKPAQARSGGGARPSRSAPQSANRSKKKKRR